MPQLHETGYGKRFFDHQLPTLIDNLAKIAENLEKLVKAIEDKKEVKDGRKS